MTIEDIVSVIPEITGDRYEISSSEEFILKVLGFRPEILEQSSALRLRRRRTAASAWRTILVTEIESMAGLNAGLKWAADVREELLNGEPADLYLLIVTSNIEQFNIEMCINIEAGDQYCRKYITRPNENIVDFMNRTFLCKFETGEQLQGVNDPLKLALLKTRNSYSDFDEAEQERWREAFLSGKGSLELADILFSEEIKAD